MTRHISQVTRWGEGCLPARPCILGHKGYIRSSEEVICWNSSLSWMSSESCGVLGEVCDRSEGSLSIEASPQCERFPQSFSLTNQAVQMKRHRLLPPLGCPHATAARILVSRLGGHSQRSLSLGGKKKCHLWTWGQYGTHLLSLCPSLNVSLALESKRMGKPWHGFSPSAVLTDLFGSHSLSAGGTWYCGR